MKFLAFACLIAVAYAYPSRLGEEKCTYGPSYWCDNYKQAVECKAVEHCRNYVWKPKGADQCDQCKAAITKLNTFVATNSSKVLEIMNNVCAGLGSSAPECKLAVQMYGEQIIAALKEITSDGEKLCKELELCTSVGNVKIIKEILVRKLKSHPYIVRLKSAKADYCNDCKLVFGEIKTVLEDDDLQKEIVAAVEDLCEEFGSFATQCKSYVDTYLPLILDELASLDDPTEICDELGLCNTTMKTLTSAVQHSVAQPEDQCDECKAAVAKLNAYVKANPSKVIEILTNLCGGIPVVAEQCKSAVQKNKKEVIAFLSNVTADGERLCKDLELCSSTDNVKIIKEILLTKLKGHPYIRALKSVKADYCEECKLVFGEIKDLLQDKDMQKEIISAVEALCDEFGSFAAQCKTYVDTYLPLVLEELASLDDPTTICDELGLCNATHKAVGIMSALEHLQPLAESVLVPIMPGPVILTPPKNVESDEDKCEECEATMKLVNYYATNNSTQLVAVMREMCATLGSKAKMCNDTVTYFGSTLIKTIKDVTAHPKKLCTELGMCSSNSKEEFIKNVFVANLKTHPSIQNRLTSKDNFCDECKLVFAEVKDILEDKSMQEGLTTLLESLCADLGSFADQCKTYVEAYLPLILEALASMDDPSKVCTELGLCNATSKAVDRFEMALLRPALKKVEAPTGSAECIICEFVMKELDSILGDKATREEIEAALDKVCSLLPSTIRSECDTFVNKYADEIITLLLEEITPDQICTKLGLCSSNGKPSKFTFSKPNDETCDLCKMAVQYLESILESNATEEEIKKALEDICNMLPASLKTECNAIVAEYGDLIIKIILGEITPDEVCELLKLCQASKKLDLKDGCILGESYWCISVENARKCNALKHCNYIH
ncbi:prosaposin-like isoform X2 [Dendronephthya gigantea]|uniref:prosaposin-like isoform X2 n=1 Tax=Dendronephthya gigantea TaxID=151771 RepID=UPI00106CB95D|nr:prosaposin-like isoform X2 [Dendronephthya gigantea]